MKRALLCAVVIVGCGKSEPKRAPEPAAGDPSDGPRRVTTQELVAAPLVSTASTAGGHAFTIDLPASLLKKPEVKDAYATWEPIAAWTDTPDFTVQFTDMALRDDETGDAAPMGDDAADRKIVRAEKLPDGGFLNLDQRTDKKFFLMHVCRPATGGKLCCTMIQRASKPIDGFADAVSLGEKICKSMKPKA